MILVVAGTLDGRELAKYLKNKGLPVILSVASEYGKSLAEQAADKVVAQTLDKDGFLAFFKEQQIKIVIDASHPYAQNVSKNIMQAAEAARLKYFRFERERTVLPDYEKLYQVEDAQTAAQKAAQLGDVIFLTTGSRALEIFKKHPDLQKKRLIARILPDLDSLEQAITLGFTPQDIIAMQGPFSKELNKEMFKACQAEVVISKESGRTGGTDSKLLAAIELQIPVVLIKRPLLAYQNSSADFAKIYHFVKESF